VAGLIWTIVVLGVLWLGLAKAGNGVIEENQIHRSCCHKFVQALNRHEKIITVVFTAILAVSTFFLWLATRDLVHDAKEASERELRAYLSVTGFHVRLVPGEEIKAQIVLTNAGKTPAYHVKSRISVLGIGEFPPTIYVPAGLPPEPEKGGGTVGPNGGLFSVDTPFAPILSQEQFNALLSKRMVIGYALYVEGAVTYIDAFNEKRTTRFYGAYGGPYGMDQTGAVAKMDEGNDSD
jgi:hypothetical protein